MFRSNFLRAAVIAGTTLATPALAQSDGAALAISGVSSRFPAWTGDGTGSTVVLPPQSRIYNSDPGFVFGGRSRHDLAPAERTPLAGAGTVGTLRNEP